MIDFIDYVLLAQVLLKYLLVIDFITQNICGTLRYLESRLDLDSSVFQGSTPWCATKTLRLLRIIFLDKVKEV